MGGAIQTITVILLKISGITVVFMVKDCYICSAKKDKQSFTMGAKIVYKSYNQNDSLLFPPALGDLIPENHPVRTVSAVIDRLDITGIESTYKGGGTKIESVANRYTFVWKGSVEKNKSKLEAKVAAVLRTAEEVLAKENATNPNPTDGQ